MSLYFISSKLQFYYFVHDFVYFIFDINDIRSSSDEIMIDLKSREICRRD